MFGRDYIGPENHDQAIGSPEFYYNDNAFPEERDNSEFRQELTTGDGRVAYFYTQKVVRLHPSSIWLPIHANAVLVRIGFHAA